MSPSVVYPARPSSLHVFLMPLSSWWSHICHVNNSHWFSSPLLWHLTGLFTQFMCNTSLIALQITDPDAGHISQSTLSVCLSSLKAAVSPQPAWESPHSLAWYLRSPRCGLTPLHHAHSLPVQSTFQALSTVSPAWSSPKFPNPCHHSSFRSFSSSPSCTFCVMFKSLSSGVRGTWIPCSQFCTQQFGVIFMAHLSCSRQHCKKQKIKKIFN